MDRDIYRKSLAGGALGAALFVSLGLYLNVSVGEPLLSNPGPVSILAVIGGTVGALVAPLVPTGRREPDDPDAKAEAEGPADGGGGGGGPARAEGGGRRAP